MYPITIQYNTSGLTTVLVVLVLALFFLRIVRIGRREAGLPPGPPTNLILGNATDIPTERAYLKFMDWAKEYGGIYSLKVFSSTVIVLTDPAAVHELLDKRSASSADRPPLYVANVVAEGMNFAMARYGKTWRLLRRCANDILSQPESNKHIPIQQAEAAQLMHDLLKTPEDFSHHLARFTNSIIMSITYGVRTPRYETKHAIEFYDMDHRWNALVAPAAHPPLDLIPALRYVPERWASWKTECREVRQVQRKLYFEFLDGVEERLRQGEETGSFMEGVLKQRRNGSLSMDRDLMAYMGGGMIEAGTETSTGSMRILISILVEHPDVVRKAQVEMDRIVGDNRIPNFDDAAQLPYIEAIIKETFRFRPLAPVVPHALLSDETYLNYHLPKGATVMMNIWGILHDPEIFDSPDTFNPDRYLLSEYGTKPGYDLLYPRWNTIVFGAGRRICPGMYLAHNSLLIAAMNLIWGFDFLRPLDENGKPVSLDLSIHSYDLGIAVQPAPFDCRIVPRSEKRAALIKANFAEALETLVKYEHGLDVEERTVL